MKSYMHVTIASVAILVFAMAFMPIGAAESQVAPYDKDLLGDGEWGGIGSYEWLSTITHYHSYRIRSSDDITKAQLWAIELDWFDEFYIGIWRENTTTPGTFDKITETENLHSKFHDDGGINTLVFDTPLTGIKEGDFYGMTVHRTVTGTYSPFKRFAEPDKNGYEATYYNRDNSGGAHQPVGLKSYAWRTRLGTGNAQPIALYTEKNTDFIFVGNSITEGYHMSGSEYSQRAYWTNVYNDHNLDNYGWAPNAKFEVLSGLSTQNMANFSAETDDILARWDKVLAMNPKNIVLAAGVNDVRHHASGVPEAECIANQISMIDSAMAAGIQMYLVETFAYGDCNPLNPEDHAELDRINDAVAAHAISVGAYVVNTDSRMAYHCPTGDPGNLWGLNDDCSDETSRLHMSAFGNDEFAAAVYEVYLANQPIPPVPGVFDKSYEDLNEATNDSWAMLGLLPIVIIAGGVLTIIMLMFAGQSVDPKLIMAIIPVIIIIITAMYVGIMIIDALPK